MAPDRYILETTYRGSGEAVQITRCTEEDIEKKIEQLKLNDQVLSINIYYCTNTHTRAYTWVQS